MKKALLIFMAILLGCIFTIGHSYTFLIRYNLMVMLFFAFLRIRFDFELLKKEHYKILIINILLPILIFCLLKPFNETYAQLAFVLTIVPTAAAGPVIAEMMGADIKLTTGAVLLTTPIIALILPFLLSFLLGIGGDISAKDLIRPILSLIFLPLLFSQGIRYVLPSFTSKLLSFSFISFPLFLTNIFIACGNASNFVQQNLEEVGAQLIGIIGLTALICVCNFQIGRYVGNKNLAFELALGRKNTMIGLVIALAYFSPIVALGPICYIVCHNIYNSIQMWQMEKMRKEV